MTFDARTERNLKTLLPLVEQMARLFLTSAAKPLADVGLRAVVTSGTRTYAKKDVIFAQGRTRAGKIVTNARGGYSNHNFGVAFDITLFKGATPVWESPWYRKIAPLAKSVGFEWGGDWSSMKDEPHYQWKTGLTLAQMRERVAKGRAVA